MTITEFAAARGVERQAVQKYIKRHPELREHIDLSGRVMMLSPEAVDILDKVYPIPKPVTVIEGVPHEDYEKVLKQLADAHKIISDIQAARIEEQQQLAELKTRSLLLEDRERKVNELHTEIEELQSELNRLHSRSLWQRIINK